MSLAAGPGAVLGPDVVDALPQPVDGGVDVDRLAGGEGIECLLDSGGDAEHREAGRPQGGGTGCVSQPCSAAAAASAQLPRARWTSATPGVQERLVEAVGGSGGRIGEEGGRPVVVAPPGGEHGAGPGHAKDPDGQGLIGRVSGQRRLGVGPATEPDEAFGGLGVEVAAEAVVEPGEVPFGDLVERRVHRLLVAAVVEERDAEVDRRERSRLRGRCRGDGVAAQLDAFGGMADVATAETEHATGHRPGQRIVGGLLDELEHALAPLLGAARSGRP